MGIGKRGGRGDPQPARCHYPQYYGRMNEAAASGYFLVRLSSNEESVLCMEE